MAEISVRGGAARLGPARFPSASQWQGAGGGARHGRASRPALPARPQAAASVRAAAVGGLRGWLLLLFLFLVFHRSAPSDGDSQLQRRRHARAEVKRRAANAELAAAGPYRLAYS